MTRIRDAYYSEMYKRAYSHIKTVFRNAEVQALAFF